LRIDEAEAETYRQELAAVERRLDLKGASQLDVDQARAALADAESAVTESRRAAEDAALALRHSFPDLVLPREAPRLPDPQALQGDHLVWRKMVIEHSHELAMAEKDAERAMSAAHRASLDRFADPTVGFRAFQERSGEETGIGVSLSIPLGVARRRAISDTMRAEAVAASVREQAMRREIAMVADRDITNMTANIEAWKQADAARSASDEVVSRMRRAVELGDRDFSELLLTLRRHFDIQRREETERAAAHRALLQFQIDAHQIWGLRHDNA
jgi:outer membrane protein TolC